MTSTLILADDLSGAADAAVAYARHGVEVVVALDERAAMARDAEVLAVDLDSRHLDPVQAADAVTRAVQHLLTGPRSLLYKKMDSTLRGNFAAEIAAARRAVAARRPADDILAVVAPAFPAMGRTVRDGRLHVDRRPLDQAEIGPRLEAAGLRAAMLPLSRIRGGAAALGDALASCRASGIEAVVCDAETDADLAAIAVAGSRMAERLVWAGSGGLAPHLAALAPAPREGRRRRAPHTGSGPVAVVVGSLSAVSRAQAARLAARADIAAVLVDEPSLRAGAGAGWNEAGAQLEAALGGGQDVLLGVAGGGAGDRREDHLLARALARLIAPYIPRLGGLVATGGDTARAVLAAGGVEALRLLGEVETGLPYGVTEGRARLWAATKAGGFGGPDALVHCREHLRSALMAAATEDLRI